MGRALSLAALIVFLLPISMAGESNGHVVVLPFENLSGEDAARRDLTFLVMGAMNRLGWGVAGPEQVQELLNRERVRYLDYLGDEARAMILEATGSDAVVSGTIYTYSEGRNPSVALAVRMVDADGILIWSNMASVSSLDTEGLFGFGRKSTLSDVAVAAVERLLEPLPHARQQISSKESSRKSRPGSKPVFYVALDYLETSPQKVCVLPFLNDTQSPDAARVVGDLISLRLADTGVEVVDAARLRDAALDLRIPSFREVRLVDLEALSEMLGTTLFLRGTIYEFDDAPALSIELILEDIRTGQVVWMAQHEREGSDYEGLLLLGGEVTVVGLADRVVRDVVFTAEAAFREGPEPKRVRLSERRREMLKGTSRPERVTEAARVTEVVKKPDAEGGGTH